jgi:hypothetical protein
VVVRACLAGKDVHDHDAFLFFSFLLFSVYAWMYLKMYTYVNNGPAVRMGKEEEEEEEEERNGRK